MILLRKEDNDYIYKRAFFNAHKFKGQDGSFSNRVCVTLMECKLLFLTYAPNNSEGVVFDQASRAISQERWNISVT